MSSIVYFPKNRKGLYVKYRLAPNGSVHIMYNTSLNFTSPTHSRIPRPMSKVYVARFKNSKKYIPIYVPNVPRK